MRDGETEYIRNIKVPRVDTYVDNIRSHYMGDTTETYIEIKNERNGAFHVIGVDNSLDDVLSAVYGIVMRDENEMSDNTFHLIGEYRKMENKEPDTLSHIEITRNISIPHTEISDVEKVLTEVCQKFTTMDGIQSISTINEPDNCRMGIEYWTFDYNQTIYNIIYTVVKRIMEAE